MTDSSVGATATVRMMSGADGQRHGAPAHRGRLADLCPDALQNGAARQPGAARAAIMWRMARAQAGYDRQAPTQATLLTQRFHTREGI